MTKKPLAVIVSGTPGSGKTTLARSLADYMMVPHIERDKITRGMEYTRGERVDRVNVSLPRYFNMVAAMLGEGISIVTDGTLYRNISEPNIQNYIIAHSFAVNIHTRSLNERQRFYHREMNREGQARDWIEGQMKILDDIYDQTVDPLDLNIPLIEVDATEAYTPSLSELVKQIGILYGRST